MHLLAGAPGTGKTILASTFAYNAVTALKEKVVYATFEESTEYLERNMKKLGIDLAAAEKGGNLKVIDLDAATAIGDENRGNSSGVDGSKHAIMFRISVPLIKPPIRIIRDVADELIVGVVSLERAARWVSIGPDDARSSGELANEGECDASCSGSCKEGMAAVSTALHGIDPGPRPNDRPRRRGHAGRHR